jgi:transposase, IS5 family
MLRVLDFGKLTGLLGKPYSELGGGGYRIEQGFRCLLLQYVEDLSDRQLERCLRENLAAKFCCGFELMDQTPEFSYFRRLRSRIGLTELRKQCNRVWESLKASGLIREVFTFVDSWQFKMLIFGGLSVNSTLNQLGRNSSIVVFRDGLAMQYFLASLNT